MSGRQPMGTTDEVAEYLRRPVRTLVQWRYLRRGPRWVKIEGQVRYRWADVDSYVARQTHGGEAA